MCSENPFWAGRWAKGATHHIQDRLRVALLKSWGALQMGGCTQANASGRRGGRDKGHGLSHKPSRKEPEGGSNSTLTAANEQVAKVSLGEQQELPLNYTTLLPSQDS